MLRRRIRAMAAVLSCTVFFMAGCGVVPESDLQKTDETSAVSPQVLKEDLVYAQVAEPKTLDPAYLGDAAAATPLEQVYETLLRFDPDSTVPKPFLAKSYSVSEDGHTYTFELQHDIRFQDGEPFNASAVKANIDRFLTPEATRDMPYADLVYGDVASVETPDEYTVVIHLNKASTPFLNNLAMSVAAPMASPKAIAAGTLAEHPVGTGPYAFASWEKGRELVLKENKGYWRHNGPCSKRLVFRFIAEDAARLAALENGDVDIIDGINPATAQEYGASKGGTVLVSTPGMNVSYLAYNTAGRFKDEALRHAVSQAINVPELVETLYRGSAKAARTILPSMVPGYSDEVTQIAYDKEAAKKTLAKAGIKELTILTYTEPRRFNPVGGQRLAEVIQGYLKQVGVDADIVNADWHSFRDRLAEGHYDLCLCGWNGDNGDADNFMRLLVDPDPTVNVARFDDEGLKNMVAYAAAMPPGPERNHQYVTIERYLAEKAPWLPLAHMDVLTAHAPTVQNYRYYITGDIYLANTCVLLPQEKGNGHKGA